LLLGSGLAARRYGWGYNKNQNKSRRAPLQDGDTALHLGAMMGEENAIKVLLEAGAETEATDKVRGGRVEG